MKNKRIITLIFTILALLMSTIVLSSCKEKNITVTFASNGGELISGKEVQTVSSVDEIEPPTYEKEGYNFSGWDVIIKEIKGDTKVTAQWEAEKYKLFLNPNGGEVSESYINLSYNSTIGELPVPVREGYIFDSWRRDTVNGEVITQGQEFKELNDINAVAKWILDEVYAYSITYDMSGAELPQNNPSSYRVTDADITLNNPTKTGYIFVGWQEAKDTKPYLTRVIKSGTTGKLYFTAVFKEMKFEINYHLSFVTEKQNQVICFVNGESLLNSVYLNYGSSLRSYLPDFEPQSSYYENKRWVYYNDEQKEVAIEKNDDATIITFTNAVVKTDKTEPYYSIDVYAVCKVDFTVTFRNNGGTLLDGEEIQVVESASEIIPPSYEREGYTFKGFDKEVSQIRGDTFVGAKWSANTYTITFDANSGAVYQSSVDVVFNETIGALPIPERAGYIFSGWRLNNVDGERIMQGQTYTFANDITIVAKWIVDDSYSYSITYNLNGGSLEQDNPETYKSIDNTFTLVNPTKEGHIFLGWRRNEENQVYKQMQITKGSTGDLFFTAEFKKMKFVVSYYLSYTTAKGNVVTSTVKGNSSVEDVELNYGDSISGYLYNFIPNRDQYKNCVWAYSKLGVETIVDSTFKLTKTAFTTAELIETASEPYYKVTLFAKCDISYTVTFKANGGTLLSGSETQVVEKADDIVLPEYSRKGYTFDGFDKLKDSINVDTVVNAKWVAKTFVITFNANKGIVDSSSMNATYDSALGELPTPTRLGYIFDGWRKESESGDLISQGVIFTETADITVYAKWTADDGAIFRITYNINGGKLASGVTNPTTYKVTDDDITLNNPTKEGYLFIGWVKGEEQTSNTTVVIESGSAGDLQFTALFKALKFEINYQLQYTTSLGRELSSKVNGQTSVNTVTIDYGSNIDEYLYDFVPNEESYKNKCWIVLVNNEEVKVEDCFKATVSDFTSAIIKYDNDSNPYYSVTIIARYYASYTINVQLYNYVYNEKRLVTFNGQSENVSFVVEYGESLGENLVDAVPIPREVADGIYFKYWYFIKNGKEVKVDSNTIFTESIFTGEEIILIPKLYSYWTPNY